jgi:diketogulonate reductase-like aldo/keto reductase
MRLITFPNGCQAPAIGQGTWKMAEHRARRAEEIAALRRGVELGLTLIDTAETYANGAAESLVGEALCSSPESRRALFLVSKVLPRNAGRTALPRACRASLKRLNTDVIDLNLLHWPGSVPLAETVEAMERAVGDGLIRAWGVSNFDLDDLAELAQAGGANCATNQILYNLVRRAPEFALLPAMRASHMPCMAYSPVEQARLPQSGALAEVASRHTAAPYQIALAWLLRRDDLIAIPKAGTVAHVEQNRAAAEILLSPEDLALLDTQFPPPTGRRSLEML